MKSTRKALQLRGLIHGGGSAKEREKPVSRARCWRRRAFELEFPLHLVFFSSTVKNIFDASRAEAQELDPLRLPLLDPLQPDARWP